ncbi:MAG: 30S ribosomal protein S7 [Candidatus Omnitrophica bacterium]|nr:30S ribosomal protein S7 [Candidatus Omnitrophota bacterium]
MRRRRAQKREVLPDPRFNNKTITKFVNMLMWCGKKSTAETLLYNALDKACQKSQEKDPLKLFQKALDNVRPLLELKPRRVGGATYQVPIEVRSERGVSIAMRWLRNAARQKKGHPMEDKLADELIAAFKGEGSAMKKREETHKMAEANKAFAHFRW